MYSTYTNLGIAEKDDGLAFKCILMFKNFIETYNILWRIKNKN